MLLGQDHPCLSIVENEKLSVSVRSGDPRLFFCFTEPQPTTRLLHQRKIIEIKGPSRPQSLSIHVVECDVTYVDSDDNCPECLIDKESDLEIQRWRAQPGESYRRPQCLGITIEGTLVIARACLAYRAVQLEVNHLRIAEAAQKTTCQVLPRSILRRLQHHVSAAEIRLRVDIIL